MELRHLRYFVAVAEEGHVGRAARRLNLAQPALTRTIQDLERELAVALFRRERRRLEITAAGLDFLRHARALLGSLDCAVRSAQRVARGLAGQLNVGCVDLVLDAGPLPAWLRALRRRAPDAVVELHERPSALQLSAVRSKELDVALVLEAPPAGDAELAAAHLYDEPLVAVLAERDPRAGMPDVRLVDLLDAPLHVLRESVAPATHETVRRRWSEAGGQAAALRGVDRFQQIASLVAGGAGAGLVPYGQHALRLPGVVYKAVPMLDATLSLHVAWRRDNALPLVDTFVALVRELVAAPPLTLGATGARDATPPASPDASERPHLHVAR